LISYQLKDNPYSMYNQMYKIKNNWNIFRNIYF
jgi:hypothetical protein